MHMTNFETLNCVQGIQLVSIQLQRANSALSPPCNPLCLITSHLEIQDGGKHIVLLKELSTAWIPAHSKTSTLKHELFSLFSHTLRFQQQRPFCKSIFTAQQNHSPRPTSPDLPSASSTQSHVQEQRKKQVANP